MALPFVLCVLLSLLPGMEQLLKSYTSSSIIFHLLQRLFPVEATNLAIHPISAHSVSHPISKVSCILEPP